MPRMLYDSPQDIAFNGNPEPDKLAASLEIVNGKLYLYENYTIYRWSWARGSNRLTNIDYEQMKIKNQVWGQKTHKDTYWGFIFFKHSLFLANGIMHFQDQPNDFKLIDTTKVTFPNVINVGKLSKKCTGIIELNKNQYVCYTYQPKQVKPKKYHYRINFSLFNKTNQNFSNEFKLDFKKTYPGQLFYEADSQLIVIPLKIRKDKKIVERKLLFYGMN